MTDRSSPFRSSFNGVSRLADKNTNFIALFEQKQAKKRLSLNFNARGTRKYRVHYKKLRYDYPAPSPQKRKHHSHGAFRRIVLSQFFTDYEKFASV